MFCPQCGSKLADGARFCPQCGARVGADAGTGPEPAGGEKGVAASPGPDGADAGRRSLAARLVEFRRTTLRAVPTFVIGIVAALLFAGTAYALYRVAVDVVIPMVQEWTEPQGQADGTGAPGDAAGEGSGDAAQPAVEATGQPDSIFQVAEILAMDPADIPAFLEGQGLTETRYNSVTGFDEPDLGSPAWAYNIHAPAAAEPLVSADVITQETLDNYAPDIRGVLSIGTNFVPISFYAYPTTLEQHIMGKSDLAASDAPNAIGLSDVPITTLNNDTITQLCTVMGVGSPSAVYEVSMSSFPSTDIALTGSVTINGAPYSWYVVWSSSDAPDSTPAMIGCVSLDIARAYVADQQLYAADEWDAATESQQMGMFAQALLQECNTGNGGGRVNLRTGESEYSNFGYPWTPLDELPEELELYAWDANGGVDPSSFIDFTVEEPSRTLGE